MIGQIKLSELKTLPFRTLSALAVAVARDIDDGQDKRELLERVFTTIKQTSGEITCDPLNSLA